MAIMRGRRLRFGNPVPASHALYCERAGTANGVHAGSNRWNMPESQCGIRLAGGRPRTLPILTEHAEQSLATSDCLIVAKMIRSGLNTRPHKGCGSGCFFQGGVTCNAIKA